MKYTTEIIVDVAITTFVEKLDNAENMKHWQQGLVDYRFLSGEPGKEGSQMELKYNMGKREMTMVETVIKSDFPNEFHATYAVENVHNIQKNHFVDMDGQRTKWVSENEFQFSGFFMKAMGFLMPGAFKKQSLKYMQDFKAFAEEGISVANNTQ